MEIEHNRVLRKISSYNKLQLYIYSEEKQPVLIRVCNFLRVPKISVWKELGFGDNLVTIDTTVLSKGIYTITLSFKEGGPIQENYNKQ